MNTMIKKLNIKTLMLVGFISALMTVFNSCNKNEGESGQVVLNSFGPSAIMRGQQLKFIGNNLNQVKSIILPDNVEVTTFVTKTPSLLVINVPDATVDGKVTLKTTQGDIVTKTNLVILEPITITSITPATARPGTTIKIQGTYLDLVASVTFGVNKVVAQANFASQSASEIDVVVPTDAQTAKIALADAQTIPNVIQSTNPFTVTLPAVTSVSPTTVKAGANLTITGTDLDLTQDVTFTGGTRLTASSFVNQSATQIVVTVPANAKDGGIILRPLSAVEVATTAITLVAPTVSDITPNPAKNSGTVTVTGTNLDLVNQVTFGGGKTGTIQTGGTAASITVKVPADAIDGKVSFATQSAKVDSTHGITLVKPTISTFTASVNTKNAPSITIDGTDLDLTASVIFKADSTLFPPSGTVVAPTNTITVNSTGEIVVKVPQGAKTGTFTLVTTNGTKLTSSSSLTIVPDMPSVTGINPAGFVAGQTITFTAASGLDIPFDVVFPGNVVAPMVVSKSSTSLSVVVPVGAKSGRIEFINYANEVYIIPIDTKILSTDPVKDLSLVFFDFNNVAHPNYDRGVYWNDVGLPTSSTPNPIDPNLTLDGSAYYSVNVTGLNSGWTGLFWRNGGANFPGATIGTDISDYVLKFDINVIEDVTAGFFEIRLKSSTEGDFFGLVGPGAYGAAGVVNSLKATSGWETLSIPLSAFRDNYGNGTNVLTDLSKIDQDFGFAYSTNGGTTTLHLAIDNVRFEKIN